MSSSPATRLRDSSTPFPLRLADTWIGDVVVVSNAGEPMTASQGCANVALLSVGLGPLAAAGLGLLVGAPDFTRAMLILTAICAPLAIYVRWAMQRYWRIAELVNRGEFDRARRALGDKRSAVFGPLVGLLAQLRGDHELAAAAYSWTIATFDGPAAKLPALSPAAAAAANAAAVAAATPTTRVTVLRGVIAFTNVGQLDAATALLTSGMSEGPYPATFEWVASTYLALCAGKALFDDGPAGAAAMAEHFRPIRGAWGGLTLAAYGLRQAGDTIGARALLEEEASRPGAEYLPALLPRLRRFIESRGEALD